ncbi:hypothetical protein [Clostridium senegalense]|uniref:hypothetical protein n=1 Tax=Clostridium senegalense TaxID=1465809 RepID=UPI001C0FC6E3|nr:hypothetical protein [Clostridium senegalense]MBU5227670.1 hypothetical protein [Clostridium senegalense]
MKNFFLSLCIILSVFLVGCFSDEGMETLNKGKKYLKEDNYVEALESFAIASNRLKKQDDKDVAKGLWHVTNGYIRAKKFCVSGEYDKAEKIILETEKSEFYKYAKDDLEILKEEIVKNNKKD